MGFYYSERAACFAIITTLIPRGPCQDHLILLQRPPLSSPTMDVAPPPATLILPHDFDTLVSAALDPSAPPPTLTLSFPGNTPFPLLPPVEKNLPHRVSGRGRRLLARLKSLVRRPRLRLGASVSRAVAPAAVAAARTAVSSLLAGERPLIGGGGAAVHSPHAHMLGHAPPSPSPSAPDCRSASARSSPAEMSSRAARLHIPAPLRPWSVFAYELAHGDPFAKGRVCVVDRSCEALPYPQLQQQQQQPASRRFRSARHRAAQRARGRAVLEYDRDSPTLTPRARARSRSPRRSRTLARAGSASSASARPSPRGGPASLTHGQGPALAPSAYAHTPLSRRPRAGSPFPLQRTGTC
ncbi:hypothetical protein GGX14DRAFT_427442 [Mycena pura]|uniref:Uncharacterized protein n=1 Tax=Mycena pura TaxID=153505 RepID=A0AAD6YM43_9AGAR|nr:hypothetical protein GGX14DRAFT_427442 [Mycena pura]